MRIAIVFLVLSFFVACSQPAADLVVTNAKIYTVDKSNPTAEALVARGNKILMVGSNEQVTSYLSNAKQVIDAGGKAMIPGLIESHAHLLGVGQALLKLDLTTVHNWQEVVDMVTSAVKKAQPGQWITGRGWHQEKWHKLPEQTVKGFPVHSALSKISPDNPVLLTHASGHAVFANAKAMQLAGVSASTADPDGGEIVRFGNGQPTGVFLENAEGLVTSIYAAKLARRSKNEIDTDRALQLQKAAGHCLQQGITTFYDAGSTLEEVDFYRQLADAGKLPMRLWLMLGEDNATLDGKLSQYRLIDYGGNFLTVRAIKRYMDGALGSRGAWLLEPYSDQPATSGMRVISVEDFEASARLAAENDFQLCTHAIGDRANREVLDVYAKFLKPGNDLRWRIEHAQHLNPAEVPRFAQMGVVAAMQGIHCTSDGPWVPKRIGEKRAEEGAYVWRKLLEAGALICNGTDAPVEATDPFNNFYALVTRKMTNGQTFYPDQVMSRAEALKAYTLNGARAGFEENYIGSLEAGKLADFVLLSQDIMTIPAEQIPQTQVELTVLDGKVVYRGKP